MRQCLQIIKALLVRSVSRLEIVEKAKRAISDDQARRQNMGFRYPIIITSLGCTCRATKVYYNGTYVSTGFSNIPGSHRLPGII